MTIRVHIGIGPVKQFIGDARRARDWWAGSFLLAWLSGRALRVVVPPANGTTPYGRNPEPDPTNDPMWQALDGKAPGWPIGTLPNRFSVEVDDLDRFAAADPCRGAVEAAFASIADAVYECFLAGIVWDEETLPDQAALTDAIWQRQTRGYFEVNWAAGELDGSGADAFWLDRRKLCRDHPRPIEPGDHCRMMGDWQELSGRFGPADRGRQSAFWETVRSHIKTQLYGERRQGDIDYPLLELGASERLCAIAFIKRLFPLLPRSSLETVIGWLPYGAQDDTTPARADAPGAVRFWPSTATLASLPWRRAAWTRAPAACRTFAERTAKLLRDEVARSSPRLAPLRDMELFGRLEGALLYADALDARISAERYRDPDSEVEKRLLQVKAELAGLEKQLARLPEPMPTGLLAPVPYYAVLVMDGDRTGELVRNHPEATMALQLFADTVAGTVGAGGAVAPSLVETRFDGLLVYAGGDDVQALLPLDKALEAALALRDSYVAAFVQVFADDFAALDPAPGISAALVIADHGEPMGAVIRAAHGLLEQRAKRDNHRNSLAIRVLKPSGSSIDLVSAFPKDPAISARRFEPFESMVELQQRFATEAERHPARFLYKVRTRWRSLFEDDHITAAERQSILLAEWLKGKAAAADEKEEKRRVQEARAAVELIVRASTLSCGDAARPPEPSLSSFLAGPFIARFFAERGVT